MKLDWPGDHFLINPYIPKVGRILFWGDTGSAKSPTTWQIAASVGGGTSFFGLPTEQANVLFIEMDSTDRGTNERLKHWGTLPPLPSSVAFCFPGPMSIPNVDAHQQSQIMQAVGDLQPGLVIVNNLLWCHDMDDKESRTVKVVYSWWQQILGDRAILFVHHEKKSPQNPEFRDSGKEKFSGAKNWLNNAQVGIQIVEHDERPITHKLWHHKSQESALYKPMSLTLARDGTNFTSPLLVDFEKIQEIIKADKGHTSKRGLDHKISKLLNISERSVRTRRTMMEHPRFPHPEAWLAKEVEEGGSFEAPPEVED